MDDVETRAEVLKIGGGFAVGAMLLYFFTSWREPSGFCFIPSTAREWVHWWFRSLILLFFAAIVLLPRNDAGTLLLAFSGLMLLTSSLGSWPDERGFCVVGFILGSLAMLFFLFVPRTT